MFDRWMAVKERRNRLRHELEDLDEDEDEHEYSKIEDMLDTGKLKLDMIIIHADMLPSP